MAELRYTIGGRGERQEKRVEADTILIRHSVAGDWIRLDNCDLDAQDCRIKETGNRGAAAQRLGDGLDAARRLVDEQAEDEALWAVVPVGEQPIAEAYLQRALRTLHQAVEEATR